MACQTFSPAKRQALQATMASLQEAHDDVRRLQVAADTDIVAHLELLAARLGMLNHQLKAIVATIAADE